MWKIYRDTKKKIKEEKIMEGKSPLFSKTLWFNLLTGAVGVGATLIDSPITSEPKVKAAFVTFVAIGNAILRFLTTQPITTSEIKE